MRVAIVGAGISGLATAFYLKRARPGWTVSVFEREPAPGGTAHTVERNGFRFEIGGNGFLTHKPDTLQWVRDAGAEHLLMPASDRARRRFIFTGRLHRLPETPAMFLRSQLLSLPQKLRVAAEIAIPPKPNDDESLQDFGYRRLGKAFTDVFLDAMTAGIYATTPDRVSVKAAFPLVARLEREHGGLFRGMLARRKTRAGPGGVLMSFKGGLGTFTRHLRDTLDVDWRLDTPVSAVIRERNEYRLSIPAGEATADRVVMAVPAYAGAPLLRGLDAELAAQLAAIEYSPVAVVGLGYFNLDHPLDGFGLLTTAASGVPVLGVLWDSSIFPDRAPEGGKLLRVMIGGQRHPGLVEQDEAGLVDTALDGVRRSMGVDTEPDEVFVQRWRWGIPNYPVGHLQAVEGLFARLARHPGLFLNCNAYCGIAMNDCVRNSRNLVPRLASVGDRPR